MFSLYSYSLCSSSPLSKQSIAHLTRISYLFAFIHSSTHIISRTSKWKVSSHCWSTSILLLDHVCLLYCSIAFMKSSLIFYWWLQRTSHFTSISRLSLLNGQNSVVYELPERDHNEYHRKSSFSIQIEKNLFFRLCSSWIFLWLSPIHRYHVFPIHCPISIS